MRLRHMNRPAMSNLLRDRLSPRYRRAIDAGLMILVGVFRRGEAAHVGLLIRHGRKREYVRVFEKRSGVVWIPVIQAHGEPFNFLDWTEDMPGDRDAACRRARRRAQWRRDSRKAT